MLGVAVSSPSGRLARRDNTGVAPTVLHLALTRAAAVRLAPVAAAQRGPQAFVDRTGNVVARSCTEAPAVAGEPLRSMADVARAVAAAVEEIQPDVVVSAGDDDAALACALVAARTGVPIARVGAGLRCGDRSVGREINRIAIDELATRLYTDGEAADEQLRAEGFDERAVLIVGSTLAAAVGRWRGPALETAAWKRYGVGRGDYVLVNLKRPESSAAVERLVNAVAALADRHPVVLCTDGHSHSTLEPSSTMIITGPLEYVDFLSLQAGAGAVLTDSAGVQEETSALGVACFTLARSSERSLTLTHGTNVLLGDNPTAIAAVTVELSDARVAAMTPCDGAAGRRIAADLLDAPWEEQ